MHRQWYWNTPAHTRTLIHSVINMEQGAIQSFACAFAHKYVCMFMQRHGHLMGRNFHYDSMTLDVVYVYVCVSVYVCNIQDEAVYIRWAPDIVYWWVGGTIEYLSTLHWWAPNRVKRHQQPYAVLLLLPPFTNGLNVVQFFGVIVTDHHTKFYSQTYPSTEWGSLVSLLDPQRGDRRPSWSPCSWQDLSHPPLVEGSTSLPPMG